MQASGPGNGGGRAFGTRDRVVRCLLARGDVRDSSGMASPKLAQIIGYPGSSIAFAQLLSGMERAGLITREVRGKRTYRVHLTAAGRERARRVDAAARPGLPRPAPARAVRHAPAPAGQQATGTPPDYDELAHRLLVQVARRLLAEAAGQQATGASSGPPARQHLDALEQQVSALQGELAQAKAARNELQAENDELREQLARIRSNLDQAEARLQVRAQPMAAGHLDQTEIALLQRLLAGGQAGEGGQRASTA